MAQYQVQTTAAQEATLDWAVTTLWPTRTKDQIMQAAASRSIQEVQARQTQEAAIVARAEAVKTAFMNATPEQQVAILRTLGI